MKFLNKKGELTTQQIIVIIILITSFIVVLTFLFLLDFPEESEKELCRNSVLSKASPISGIKETPLNCYTSYVCITEDGSCEGMVDPRKEKVKTLNETYEVLANEMADCWWMYGEGKINYIEKEFVRDNYCSICNQILFDDSLKNIEGIEDGNISKNKLYNYLIEEDYNEDVSYALYLFGADGLIYLKDALEKGEDFGEIRIGKEHQQHLVMGITSQSYDAVSGVIRGAAATGAIGAFVVCPFTGGAGCVAGAVIIGGVIGAGAIQVSDLVDPEIGALVIEGESGNQFMAPTIQEAKSEKFKALNCEEIVSYT